MSDTPETSAPALGGAAQPDAGQPGAITDSAAAEALHLNTGDVSTEAADNLPIGSLDAAAAAMTGDAAATAALAGAAPNLDGAKPTVVLGADVGFVDGKPVGVTLTDGVNTTTGANVSEALDALKSLAGQAQPDPNVGTAPPITDEAPPAPTVSLPAIEPSESLMRKLENILMPRGGVVAHSLEDLEHVAAWFHAELTKARAAVVGLEQKLVADARLTLAEGRALLADRPEVSSVEIIEGTLHRVGGIIKRAL